MTNEIRDFLFCPRHAHIRAGIRRDLRAALDHFRSLDTFTATQSHNLRCLKAEGWLDEAGRPTEAGRALLEGAWRVQALENGRWRDHYNGLFFTAESAQDAADVLGRCVEGTIRVVSVN